MSVLTPVAPSGGGVDTSAEAADSAVFAGLLVKEEHSAAPAAASPFTSVAPAAAAPQADADGDVAPLALTPEPASRLLPAPASTSTPASAATVTTAAALFLSPLTRAVTISAPAAETQLDADQVEPTSSSASTLTPALFVQQEQPAPSRTRAAPTAAETPLDADQVEPTSSSASTPTPALFIQQEQPAPSLTRAAPTAAETPLDADQVELTSPSASTSTPAVFVQQEQPAPSRTRAAPTAAPAAKTQPDAGQVQLTSEEPPASPAPQGVSQEDAGAAPAPAAALAFALASKAAAAAPVVAPRTAAHAAVAQMEAALEVAVDDSGDQPPPPAPSRPGPQTPPQDAAQLGVTGFRSGAGERLAFARETAQAETAAQSSSEAPSAERTATSEASPSPTPGRPSAPAPVEASAPTASASAPAPEGDAPATTQGVPDSTASQTPGASRDHGLSQLSRATVETTAQIAAQIIKKLDGRSTRFDMALTPEGLGRVDVSLEIEADGQVTARLAFDNPAAAADLRARADELRRQLLDAGLQLSRDDLEFAERDPSSGFGGGAFERQPDRRAFAGAARLAAEADVVASPPSGWTSLSLTPDRVDLKV